MNKANSHGAMSLDTVLRFGKYKGLSIGAICKFAPEYLAWARRNIDGFELDEAAMAALKKSYSHFWQQSMNRQDGWCWGFGASVKRASDAERMYRIRTEMEERRKAGAEEPQP